MRKRCVYLAASVFSSFDRERNGAVAEEIREIGFDVFMPQSVRTATGERPPASTIFRECVDGVDRCDLIVALVDGPDVDSGTAFELGYGHARGKPSIAVRTDYRSAEHGPVNIMIEFSSRLILANKPGTPSANAIQELRMALLEFSESLDSEAAY